MKRLILTLVLIAACKDSPREMQDGHGKHEEHEEHEENAEHEEHEEHEGAGGEETLRLTPAQMKSAHVETASVVRMKYSGDLVAAAQIEVAEGREARVGPRVSGRVTAFFAGAGDQVKKGRLLATLEAPELGRAKADYLSAIGNADVAQKGADREKALFERKVSSEQSYREAEAKAISARADKDAAENRLHAFGLSDADLEKLADERHYDSSVSVTAPLDGTIVERSGTLGQMLDPTHVLFRIIDASEVWILLSVYERDLARVSVGQAARVSVGAFPTDVFAGKVQSIGGVVDPRTRTVKVRVTLANPDGRLKPGMSASVALEGSRGEERSGLFVPSAAVQRGEKGALVFLMLEQAEFRALEVTAGEEAQGWVEIEDGLEEGQKVVTTGSFLLKSELMKEQLGGGHEH